MSAWSVLRVRILPSAMSLIPKLLLSLPLLFFFMGSLSSLLLGLPSNKFSVESNLARLHVVVAFPLLSEVHVFVPLLLLLLFVLCTAPETIPPQSTPDNVRPDNPDVDFGLSGVPCVLEYSRLICRILNCFKITSSPSFKT
jgi:hypothetical protein